MGKFFTLALSSFLIFFIAPSLAADPDMLQDVCVADLKSTTKVNGFVCKPTFAADDFFFAGIAYPAPTNNTFGATVTPANVMQVPGLNTLGVSMARIDYGPLGLNPPHTHPRGTEMIFVLEGTLFVGFITTANAFVSKTIYKGDTFVFPRGLVHFQLNPGHIPAAVVAAFNSQNPGVQVIAVSLFAATPPVPDIVLSKAFQISEAEVEVIKKALGPKTKK